MRDAMQKHIAPLFSGGIGRTVTWQVAVGHRFFSEDWGEVSPSNHWFCRCFDTFPTTSGIKKGLYSCSMLLFLWERPVACLSCGKALCSSSHKESHTDSQVSMVCPSKRREEIEAGLSFSHHKGKAKSQGF